VNILGIDGMRDEEIEFHINHGARFIVFEYCVSIIILTFKRPSSIYFVRDEEGIFGRAIFYSLISLLFGLWGIPWGPLHTCRTIITNFRGGLDVTSNFLAAAGSEKNKNLKDYTEPEELNKENSLD